MYTVLINNNNILSSNSITECINKCLSFIPSSFKEFNKSNQALILLDDKIVWDSKIADVGYVKHYTNT